MLHLARQRRPRRRPRAEQPDAPPEAPDVTPAASGPAAATPAAAASCCRWEGAAPPLDGGGDPEMSVVAIAADQAAVEQLGDTMVRRMRSRLRTCAEPKHAEVSTSSSWLHLLRVHLFLSLSLSLTLSLCLDSRRLATSRCISSLAGLGLPHLSSFSNEQPLHPCRILLALVCS